MKNLRVLYGLKTGNNIRSVVAKSKCKLRLELIPKDFKNINTYTTLQMLNNYYLNVFKDIFKYLKILFILQYNTVMWNRVKAFS